MVDQLLRPVAYRTVHQGTRYRLQGKLKVPRPVSEKHKAVAPEEFKKNSHVSSKQFPRQSESFLNQWKSLR
jgi:hypothetical protein